MSEFDQAARYVVRRMVLVPLLAGGDERAMIDRWAALAGAVADEALRADVGGVARVFAGLADRTGAWQPTLEGWGMERSEFLVERESRAQLANTRRLLTLLLWERFGQEVPTDLANAIVDPENWTAR